MAPNGAAEIRKLIMPAGRSKASPRSALDHQRLRRVLQFIEANLHNNIRLKDLADIANLSQFHFSRGFRKATGQSPHRFVRDCRLDKAKEMLVDGTSTLAEIALVCNFSSQSSFTRAFTQAVGISPNKYRQSRRSPSVTMP